MKLALLFVVALAAVAWGHTHLNYVYVSYYSNSHCSEFRGSRAVLDTTAFFQPASGGSCGVELACLVEPSSRSCERVKTDAKLVAVSADTHHDDDDITLWTNFVPANVSSEQCLKSTVYENCWYRVVDTEDYDDRLSNSCRGQFSHEQIIGDDDDSTNTFAYLTYYSDESCAASSFAGQRMFDQDPSTVTGASGGEGCAQQMACLLDFTSPACQNLTHTTSLSLYVEVDVEERQTNEYENPGVRTRFDSDDCTKSGLFADCYFRWYTADEMETYSDGCDDVDGYSGSPSVSIDTTLSRTQYEGVSWFFSTLKSSSPASIVSVSVLGVAAAVAVALL